MLNGCDCCGHGSRVQLSGEGGCLICGTPILRYQLWFETGSRWPKLQWLDMNYSTGSRQSGACQWDYDGTNDLRMHFTNFSGPGALLFNVGGFLTSQWFIPKASFRCFNQTHFTHAMKVTDSDSFAADYGWIRAHPDDMEAIGLDPPYALADPPT